MKKQILFVDDDCNVVEGLKRMLRPQRDEWETQCALSGSEALEMMAAKPIDLIVSDMRMPGMDGAELLHEVTKRHPGAIRMILSGQADSELIMKAVGVAHQFIGKPCDAEMLKSIIRRAFGLRTLLQDGNLKNVISEMDMLPSAPVLYLEMMEELKSPDPSVAKVGHIIGRDPAMAARILQLANSAFFGLRRRVSNPSDAVAYLGLDRVRFLFLAMHAFSQFAAPQSSAFSIDRLWEHSFSTAARAKAIAEEEDAGKDIAEDAFTAGLLHDIGKLVLACRLPDKCAESVTLAKVDTVPLYLAERKVLSITHAEIGAYLLGLWGLPDSIVEATAYHHHPQDCTNQTFSALTALHLADCESSDHSYAEIPAPAPDTEYLSRFLRKTDISAMAAKGAP